MTGTDFTIYQGSTFFRELRLTDGATVPAPINLTGYLARGMIKSSAQDTTATASFSCSFSANRTDGKIFIELTPAQTSAIPATGSNYTKLTKYYYDLEIEDSLGKVTRILQGLINVSPEVTK